MILGEEAGEAIRRREVTWVHREEATAHHREATIHQEATVAEVHHHQAGMAEAEAAMVHLQVCVVRHRCSSLLRLVMLVICTTPDRWVLHQCHRMPIILPPMRL